MNEIPESIAPDYDSEPDPPAKWTGEWRPTNHDQSPTIGKLADALAKAQGEIKPAAKQSVNPFFESKYADLASVWDACRSALSKNNIAVVQTTKGEAGGPITVITTLLHSSGEWMRGELPLKPTKQDPQAIGSAITYGRRYGLAAIVGVAPEDDDAQAAYGQKTKEEPVFGGPLKKTQLQKALREFDTDLQSCTDADQLNALIQTSKAVLEQCERDMPSWYFGKEGSDVKGFQERIADATEALNRDSAIDREGALHP